MSGSRLVSIFWVRGGFVSGSCLVLSVRVWVRVRLVRIWVRVSYLLRI